MKVLYGSTLQRCTFRIGRLRLGYAIKRLWCVFVFLLFLSPIFAEEGQRNNAVPPLSATHAFLDGPGNCLTCHEQSGQPSTQKCLKCHSKISEQIEMKSGNHADRGQKCLPCHTMHRSANPISASNEASAFNHAAQTGFDLTGKHAELQCEQCHGEFRQTPNPSCISCHSDAHGGGLGSECSRCHTPTLFQNASRAFHKTGTFPLEGRHLALECEACHLRGEIEGTPNRCYDCHWIRHQDDPFRTQLGNECEECHNPMSWTAVRFNHPSASGVALNAGHRMLDCEECHINGDFSAPPLPCYSCHQEDYQSAQNPNHVTAGFSTDCEECHRISDPSFAGARFNHNSYYPLLGVHATSDCSACHIDNVYQGTPRECYPCHVNDYKNAGDPNHVTAGFSTDCEECHRPSDPSFSGAVFNHSSYALVGTHATLDCSACHINDVYEGTPRDCASCHLSSYQGAQDPNHIGAGFPTDCELCHQASHVSWDQGTFSHPDFPITSGKHANFECSECHTDPSNYEVFSCTRCHDRGDTNEHHEGIAGYIYDSQACYSCHPQGRE